MKVTPLRNKIFFQFEEKIVMNEKGNRSFEDSTASGIVVMGNTENATKQPRWARVIAVGPTTDPDIKEGSRIMIEALRWTDMFTLDGVDFWQTNDEEVLLVED